MRSPILFRWVRPGGAGGRLAAVVWIADDETQVKQWETSANCQKGSASTALSWVFPSGIAGFTLEIDLSGDFGHSEDLWAYKYQWQP